MKSFGRWIPLVVALVVVVAGTMVHGVITDRWAQTDSEALQRFTERVLSALSA